jgi:hypothetical protein
MMKSAWQHFSKGTLASVPEGCMAKIMAKRDRFGEVLIQSQSSSHGSGNLADFESMGESSTIMVSLRGQKHLGFVLQSSKSFTMQNAITVNLENRANRTSIFSDLPAF